MLHQQLFDPQPPTLFPVHWQARQLLGAWRAGELVALADIGACLEAGDGIDNQAIGLLRFLVLPERAELVAETARHLVAVGVGNLAAARRQVERLHIADAVGRQVAEGVGDLLQCLCLVDLDVELDARRAVTRRRRCAADRDARLAGVNLLHQRAEQAVVVQRTHVDARHFGQVGLQAPAQRGEVGMVGDASTPLLVHAQVDDLAVAPVEPPDDILAGARAAALRQPQLVVAQGDAARDLHLAQDFVLEDAVKKAIDSELAAGDGGEQVFLAAQIFAAHRFHHRLFDALRRQIEAIVAFEVLQPLVNDLLAMMRALPLAFEVAVDGRAGAGGARGLQPEPIRPRRARVVVQFDEVEMAQHGGRFHGAPVDDEAPGLLSQVRVHIIGIIDDGAALVEGEQLALRAENIETLGQCAKPR